MNTRLMILGCVLALVAAGVLPVGAEIVDDFPEVVIFATNSIDIGANSTVFSGDVVANDLTPGVELTIGNKATFPAGWEVKADSLDVGNNVNFDGSVICNEGDALCSPGTLTQAVYGALPVHQSPGLPLGVLPVVVPKSGSGSITPGDYGDVSVGLEGTITFQGPGVFNIGSFTSGRKAQINVTGAWAEIRVHGDMNTGVEDNINVNAGAPDASEVIFYVAGNALLGSKTTVNANVYATGSLELESNFTGTGAYLATDIVIGQKSSFNLDTFFDFQPEADPDSASTLEDAAVVIDVLANDSDPEGDPIFVNSFTQGGNGAVTCTGGGLGPCANGDTLTYTPNPDYFGPDSFTYEVCDVDTQINEDNCVDSVAVTVTVDSVNDPPSFEGSDQTVNEDAGPQTVSPWATSISPGPPNESAQTVAFMVSNDNNGLFSAQPAVDPAGTLTYTPAADAFGSTTITVTAKDNGGIANGGDDTSDPQTFTITVQAVNDAPSFVKGPDQGVDEDAGPQSVSAWATGISPGPANESSQTVSFEVTNDNNGLFSAQPAVDPAGNLTYTPAADAFGSATVSVQAKDNGGTANGGDDTSDAQTFTITVASINDPPNARDDSASTDEDTATTINVLANDDAGPANENQGLTLRVVSSSGTADVDGSNNVTYTPVPDFSGTDNLIYEICDGGQDDNLATDGDDLCDQATVTITVNPVNDDPVADPQAVATQGAAALTITLTGSDGDGDSLTFSITSGPDTGKGSLSGVTPVSSTSANVTYTPVNADNEENQFTFQVDDGSGTGTAIVTINPIETCASDSDCDAGFFCGTEGVCEPTPLGQIDARDQAVEANVDDLGAGIPVGILLNAAAPDTIGDLAFSLVGSPPATPPVSTATSPVRSATTTYTPSCTPAPVCTETFQFQACEVAAPTNCDTATVTIDVTTFEATPPVEARDQMVSTPMNTPVDIALSGGAGSCDPADPDCRPGTSAAVRGTTAPEARVRVSRGGTPDDTGAAPAGDTVALANPRPGTSAPHPATRAAAPGEDLFAIDSDLDQLFAVDPADGSATLQGSTSAGPTTPASLAFDGTKMYTIDLGGGGLYTLNVADGTPTFVCSTGIGGWQGVASDPTDEGQFYGITQSDELYRIDRTDCTITLVASGVGGLIAALEFDADGTLWGAEFGSPGATTENAALVKIDKTSGAVTIVSQCATKPCTGSDNFLDGFQGIDFATDGTLYGANTNDDSLYIIDTTDGSVTNLGPHGTPVFVKGLAFSELVLLEPGFTITTLPAVGTLSYLNPATGTQTSIASDDLPLLLPTEQVTYTPPTGATGDPLATFEYQQSDGLTADTGFIQLVVTGVSVIVDPCVAVGRPPGCNAGEAAGAGGENLSEISTRPETPGGVPNLRIVVEGKGTVTTSRRETRSGSVPGLSCGGECGGRFDAGAEVLLFARTLENSVFAGWAGDCSGSEPITTVRVGRRTTCIAIFEAE